MILSKIPNGFSLIEAVIALLVLGVLMGPIFKFQSQLTRGIFRAHNIAEHIPDISKTLANVERNQLYQKEGKQKIENKEGVGEIIYQTEAIAKGSSLAKIKNIKKETIQIKWPTPFAEGELNFVGLRFVIPGIGNA